MYTQPLNHWNHTVFIDNAKQDKKYLTGRNICLDVKVVYRSEHYSVHQILGAAS